MDYYEELGISPNATEEDIGRAHRRMTKLLHPDQQTDEALKQLAEVQMRRLNMIVDVLLDPESRLDYDEQLREDAPYIHVGRAPSARPRRRKRPTWPWWLASIAAAMGLTMLVVWFWADHLGSSFGSRAPTYIPPDTRDPPASAAEVTAPPAQPPQAADTPTVVQSPLPLKTLAEVPTPKTQDVPEAKPPEPSPPAVPAHKPLVLPSTQINVHARQVKVDVPPPPGLAIPSASRLDSLPVASLPSAPLRPPAPEAEPATKTANYTAPTRPLSADPLEGEWVYAPSEPEKKKAGFYPPEFIDLKLVRDDGRLHGEYRARYQVADKPIPPNVEFALSPDSEQNKFTWQAPNGSRGTLKISSVEGNVMRIEWKTTVFTRKPALTAGTATLVKRVQ